jgi:hypothetical protein
MLSQLSAFDRKRALANIKTISIRDISAASGSENLPVQRQPLSYENTKLDSTFEQAWDAWDRLFVQTNRVCSSERGQCPLRRGVVRFVRGPEYRVRGYALCEIKGSLKSATYCRIVAYSTKSGDQYILVHYRPIIAIDEGGPIGTSGMLEMSCGFEKDDVSKQLTKEDIRARVHRVLSTPDFKLAVPPSPKYSNQARILNGVNNGKQMVMWEGKFAYLSVDVDGSPDTDWVSVRMIARASIRAEKDTSRYPVISVDEAGVIAKRIGEEFGKVGYKCETFNDQ